MSRRLPPRVWLLLVYALPPLLVAALCGGLWFAQDHEATAVEIRDGERLVTTATRAEALDYIEERTGMRPLLPTVLPRGGHQLTGMSAVVATPPAVGYLGAYFLYEIEGRDPSRFWVDQFAPGSVHVPNEFLPVVTTVEGARIWTLGAPPEGYDVGPDFQFVFMARSTRYDRVVVFEGTARPDTDRAREVIESMLRQEDR
ncbi:MAG: hypothetical protein K1X87_02140 [Dehalococcoidia bacterium]|nr:hypothetical protein [Dehalococcoidia bacterium]